jgi:hypothetical protein
LPATYVAARRAIAECARIDECKSWADQAAALASYARQAKDRSLRLMAARIHARAVRRCGELLKRVPSGQGSKNQHGELRAGGVTRQEAAREAGLSERQKVMALRMASVTQSNFDALVDSDSPPTVTQLAELGKRAQTLPSTPRRPDPLRAARAKRMFLSIRDFCHQNNPRELAAAFSSDDDELLQTFVSFLGAWIDEFRASLIPSIPHRSSDQSQ